MRLKIHKHEKLEKFEFQESYCLNNAATDPVLAAQDGRIERLKALIEKGALLDIYRGCPSFRISSRIRDSDVGMTPLHWAVENASPEVVELLILAGADRNLISIDKQTPMQMLEECLKLEKYKDCWAKLKEVKAMFKKYENREFKPSESEDRKE